MTSILLSPLVLYSCIVLLTNNESAEAFLLTPKFTSANRPPTLPMVDTAARSSDNNQTPMSSNNGEHQPFFIRGPPSETRPDYENITGPLGKFVDDIFMRVFRGQLAHYAEMDSDRSYSDYTGIMEVAAALNRNYSDRREIQKRAQDTLRSLFPSWMPGSYAVLFSKPFPKFSARMNAWATWWAGTWLMGECEVNDVQVDGGQWGERQGLHVKRCRFLEEAGCASVCVNSCKIPTQKFFLEDMGLPLTMEPNYETFECQFSFGKTPDSTTELDAKNTPCLSRCPTAGGLRQMHSSAQCQLMENNNELKL